MLEVVNFLKTNSLDDLKAKFSISINRHYKHPNLVHLKYNQIESPMSERIVQECRGLILDAATLKVVAFPYTKFFNHGEHLAAKIDWTTARVNTKEDGSLITLFYYRDEWHVSTSGTADARGKVNLLNISFAELFWKVWNELGYKLPSEPFQTCCFMFELLTPYNRVVVPQHRNRIVLHGYRDLQTMRECYPSEVLKSEFGWEIVKQFRFDTWEEVLKSTEELNPLESEGYVVTDAYFNRVKVKGVKYVALHHLKDSATPNNMLDLVRRNEGDEFLTYFPEFKNSYQQISGKFEELVKDIEMVWDKCKNIESQKDFALTIQTMLNPRITGILFSLRKGVIASIRNGLKEISINRLSEVLGIEDLTLEDCNV